MIFVTVGSLFPFDRLIRAMDAWSADRAPGRPAGAPRPAAAGGPGPEAAGPEEVFAQIGAGAYVPRHMRWTRRLEPEAFEAAVARARLVVAHAGVGTVVTAARFGRPVVVLPRRRHLGEHTSDHQLETAGWLKGKPGVWVAAGEAELAARIAAALALPPGRLATLPPHAPPAFIARIRQFILE